MKQAPKVDSKKMTLNDMIPNEDANIPFYTFVDESPKDKLYD